MTPKELRISRQLALAKRALRHADAVMSYCGGDKWERECTAKDRAAYVKLFERVMGRESEVS